MCIIRQSVKQIAIGVGLLALVGMGGCVMHGTPEEIGDSFEYFITGHPTEKMRKKEGVLVKTPSGYTVNLYKGLNVYYGGELVHIQEITPPYVGLCGGKHKPGRVCIKPYQLTVKIEDYV